MYESILVTGATGSIGNILLDKLLTTKIKKIICFARDETKINIMKSNYKDNRICWFIGNIRDYKSINQACHGVDVVFHSAALKHVSTGQQFPLEVIKTNIFGTQNVIDACKNNRVRKLIFMSTDKAVEPSNIYGMSKSMAEKMIMNETKLDTCIVRSGNVLNSRGSVIPYYKKLKALGKKVPLTDMRMKRWFISKKDIANVILYVINNGMDKYIYVPKMKTVRIIDLVKKLGCQYYITGKKEGEKLEEKLFWNYENPINYYDSGIEFYLVKGD